MMIVLDVRTATVHFLRIGRYLVNLSRALVRIASDLLIALLHDSL